MKFIRTYILRISSKGIFIDTMKIITSLSNIAISSSLKHNLKIQTDGPLLEKWWWRAEDIHWGWLRQWWPYCPFDLWEEGESIYAKKTPKLSIWEWNNAAEVIWSQMNSMSLLSTTALWSTFAQKLEILNKSNELIVQFTHNKQNMNGMHFQLWQGS